MMTTTRRLLLAGSLLALGLSGCDTTTETPAPSNTKTANLTASPWHITAWTLTTDGGAAVNQLAALPACARDDRYVFGANLVLTRNEGPLACSGGTPQGPISASPWNFNSTQTVLTIGSANMGTSSIAYEVVRLTADAMQLRYTRTSSGRQLVDNISYEN